MNELIKTGAALTMSSREIAELVESRHDNVKTTIERLAARGVIKLPATQEVKNHLGQTVSEYHVGKRDCILARKYEDSLLDCVVSLVGDRADPSFCELEELFRAGFYGVIGLSGPQNRNGVQ